MGVIKRIKNKIGTSLTQIKGNVYDKVDQEAQLSQRQIEQILKKKEDYYNLLDLKSEESLNKVEKILGSIAVEVHQAYLEQIHELYTPLSEPESFDLDKRIASFDITKWVFDTKENYIDKLVNVYHVLSRDKCNIALIFNRTKEKCKVRLAVMNSDETQDINKTESYIKCLISAVKGNFPGCEFSDYEVGNPLIFNDYGDICYKKPSIASVTNVASEKSEKFISQSIEKLFDGIIPEEDNQEYTIVLLAEPVQDQLEHKNELSQFYSDLSPFSSWQTNHTYSEADNSSASFALGMNAGIGAGFNKGFGTGHTGGTFATKPDNNGFQHTSIDSQRSSNGNRVRH